MNLRNPFRSGGPDGSATSANGKVPAVPEAPKGMSGRILQNAVERALVVQAPLVKTHIAKVRRDRPTATPAEIVATLDRQFLLAVGGTGAAAGGAAFIPAIGTAVSLATATAEAIAALDASVLYVLAMAEVHGLPTDELERRRALVLGIVLGEGGNKLMRKVTGGSQQWAQELTDAIPLPKLGPVNQTLVRYFIRRYAVRQGALAFGRALPLGAGVVIGAAGNVAVAKGVIRNTELAFGPPPPNWPKALPAS